MAESSDSLTDKVSGPRVWLPAILLLVVAIFQITLAMTADLSPWKGGGFGMFASIDGTAFRRVRVTVAAPDRDEEELEISPSQEVLAARAKLFPSDSMFLKLASAIEARERRYGRPVSIVRLEVWRGEFNEYLEGTDRPLRVFTWQADRSLDNLK